jgi:transposase
VYYTSMNTTKTKFPPTTLQQRQLLFRTWEETGSVKSALQKARVSKQTFYYWLPRFKEDGYAGLENRSSAPKQPYRTPDAIEQQVIALKREHPEWGKRRIADELTKGNSWVPVVSPNTVKRILLDAGLWPQAEGKVKKGARGSKRGQPSYRDRP